MVLVKFILNILFVKEPTLECGFWLIIEGYIVFLFEFLSWFISGCCLATIYPNTTSPVIPIHVIILKCLVSSARGIIYWHVPQAMWIMIWNLIVSYLQLFKWLNKLGLCRSVTSTRAVIDRICQDFDLEIKRWKNNIQVKNYNHHNYIWLDL